MTINLILLVLLTVAAVWAVVRGSLLRAAIALAVASILLSVLMFRLQAPLAAVFELSVCAGLITVIFMSAISMTKPLSPQEIVEVMKERARRYWYLPALMAAAAVALALAAIPAAVTAPAPAQATDVREVLWNLRQLDLLGQILILLVGVFGIVVLFKDSPKSGSDI
ncbi:MAG: NADH-quinone oxidoreductase subunit J [Endomicrobiales bacterium]